MNNNHSDFSTETETERVEGVLETLPDFGFLRRGGMRPSPDDVYISLSQIRKFDLRMGDKVAGSARPPKEGERYWGLLRVDEVNNQPPREAHTRPFFEDLTPIFPREQIKLETDKNTLSTRLIDLVCPVGYGQRGLIVSPPYAGKTWLLQNIAHGVTANAPRAHLMVVLIGERPEEVTEMQRSVKGEVVASNFDEEPQDQVRAADLALERAKRLVEEGANVVMLVDSITRLARAHNLVIPPSGRTLTGGFDPAALYPPKHFFGAARNVEKGGSLTIMATTLVETGSRMDDLIYEEFKGTGNMELFLDRRLAERRIFPAIDITRSYTRRDDLLHDKKTAQQVLTLRRMIDLLGKSPQEVTSVLLERLKKTKDNKEFLENLKEA